MSNPQFQPTEIQDGGARLDNSDLNELLAQATAAAAKEPHEELDPADWRIRKNPLLGLLSRLEATGSTHVKWKHVDGPLLVCADGSCHWLTLLERLGLRAGWLTLAQLDCKYNSEPRQSAG